MREAGFLYCRLVRAARSADVDDRKAWQAANPSSWITDEDLEREVERLPESCSAGCT